VPRPARRCSFPCLEPTSTARAPLNTCHAPVPQAPAPLPPLPGLNACRQTTQRAFPLAAAAADEPSHPPAARRLRRCPRCHPYLNLAKPHCFRHTSPCRAVPGPHWPSGPPPGPAWRHRRARTGPLLQHCQHAAPPAPATATAAPWRRARPAISLVGVSPGTNLPPCSAAESDALKLFPRRAARRSAPAPL
jgi:hypothetical protein